MTGHARLPHIKDLVRLLDLDAGDRCSGFVVGWIRQYVRLKWLVRILDIQDLAGFWTF
jgi:hypothetical protein